MWAVPVPTESVFLTGVGCTLSMKSAGVVEGADKEKEDEVGGTEH